MSSEKKSYLKIFIGITIIVAALLLTHVFLILEIKSLNKELKKKTELLSIKKNLLDEKNIEIQKLSSEDRIVRIAESRLGLVRSIDKPEKLVVNKELINKINRIVNGKYE